MAYAIAHVGRVRTEGTLFAFVSRAGFWTGGRQSGNYRPKASNKLPVVGKRGKWSRNSLIASWDSLISRLSIRCFRFLDRYYFSPRTPVSMGVSVRLSSTSARISLHFSLLAGNLVENSSQRTVCSAIFANAESQRGTPTYSTVDRPISLRAVERSRSLLRRSTPRSSIQKNARLRKSSASETRQSARWRQGPAGAEKY